MNARSLVIPLVGVCLSLISGSMHGCASTDDRPASERLADPRLDPESRALAVAPFLTTEGSAGSRAERRDHLVGLYADFRTPRPVRLAVLESLSASAIEEDRSAILDALTFLLATEPDPLVGAYASAVAGEQGWTALTTPLVRRLAIPLRGVRDSERSEAEALAQLHPGRTLAQIAMEVFLRPLGPDVSGDRRLAELDIPTKSSDAAWQLLARLDPGGSMRRAMLAEAAEVEDPDGRLDAVRALDRDFGIIPITTGEIAWVRTLRDGSEADRAWWDEAKRAYDGLSPAQRSGLGLRHLEPIRYASAHRSQWLGMREEQLREILRQRLRPRSHSTRTADFIHPEGPNREGVDDWIERMVWGDWLAALVIDDAVFSSEVIRELAIQIPRDTEDTSTEHGGSIETNPDGSFRLEIYLPRPSERRGDYSFIVSDEMLEVSDKSLAHFHFHAQRPAMIQQAGPSLADLGQAARSGRSSLVFTTVGSGRVNADYYTPNGAVIDLGTIDLRRAGGG